MSVEYTKSPTKKKLLTTPDRVAYKQDMNTIGNFPTRFPFVIWSACSKWLTHGIRLLTVNKSEKRRRQADKCERGDEITMGSVLPDGSLAVVRHTPDHKVSCGKVRAIREGEPLTSDAILVERIEGNRYRVQPALEACHKGPCRVVSEGYRDGWDRVFGRKPSTELN